MSADQSIEQAIQAAGANVAPRVTLADIEANVGAEFYFTAHEGVLGAHKTHNDYQAVRHDDTRADVELARLTFCVLVLRNGFTVTGESACVSTENFNEEIGRKIARANAVEKMWPLMGYELKERLHQTRDFAVVTFGEQAANEVSA